MLTQALSTNSREHASQPQSESHYQYYKLISTD